jgi:hypothetical protein
MRARDRDRDREYGGPVLTPHPLSSRSGDEEYSLSVAFSPILDSLNPNIGSMVAVLGVRVFKGEPDSRFPWRCTRRDDSASTETCRISREAQGLRHSPCQPPRRRGRWCESRGLDGGTQSVRDGCFVVGTAHWTSPPAAQRACPHAGAPIAGHRAPHHLGVVAQFECRGMGDGKGEHQRWAYLLLSQIDSEQGRALHAHKWQCELLGPVRRGGVI